MGGGSRTCGRSQPGRMGVQPEGVGAGPGIAASSTTAALKTWMNILQGPHYGRMVITAFFPHDARLQDVSRGRCEVKAGGEGGRGGQICF